VCRKACDVVFYCPSAFVGKKDYPYPFCSPECAASWAEYEIGDSILFQPEYDSKRATATTIQYAIDNKVGRHVPVMNATEYSSRMFGGMKIHEDSEEVFPTYETLLAKNVVSAPVSTAKEGKFEGE
jgi:hypothetical protein